MKLRRPIREMLIKARGAITSKKYRKITSLYDINGYKRIYFIHVRKTGGTSLNNLFLNLSGEDTSILYQKLAKKADHRIISGNKVYVGWNVQYINGGKYFYAFSHTPLYQLNLPKQTFTVTSFRDPVKRVISHYNMLMDFRVNNIKHPSMLTQGDWLGNSFDDFLKRTPREYLCNQLYMFSERFDIDEALERISELSHFFFTENFKAGIDSLNNKTGLSLETIHIRKGRYSAQISKDNIDKLKEMLDKEYILLDGIREL